MTQQSEYRFPDSGLTSARHLVAITPDDTAEITMQCKAIYVGATGDIVLRGKDSSVDVTLKGVPAGAVLAIDPAFIRSTDTTASVIVALA